MQVEVNGENVYCFTGNFAIESQKDSVVFIHGAGMDHTVWTPFVRHLGRHGRNVIAVDLPAHGRSAGPVMASVEDMSDWIVALLDSLGIERAALVGHSLGSLVALDCAARHPSRIRALALVATTAPMPVSDAILDAAASNDHAAFDLLTQWGYSKRHQLGGNGNPGMWMIGSTLRLFERSQPGVLHADMQACNEYHGGLERAEDIRCPVLVVLGQQDRLTPLRGCQPLLDALPSPDVRVIANCGHTIMVEATNELQDALDAAL